MATNQSRTKDMVSSSFQCPMLSSSNYTVWAMKMKVLLRIQKVWETIEPGSTDSEKNDVAIGLLFQAIPEALILQVGEQDSSKGIWDAIKSRNVGADRVKEARLQTLMSEFERLKMMDTDTIDDYAGKLSELASKSAALGTSIDQTKLVKKFLNSLPRSKFIHIIASLEQVLDLKTTSFEDIIGRLKAYEERILNEENNEDTQGKLMFASSDQSNSRGRGRGRGGRGSRGRGRGSNQGDQYGSKEKKDRSKVICYRCDKPGHFASACPDRPQKRQEANTVETEEADDDEALYMHEVVYLNEDKVIPKNYETSEMWYLDNGASNHMTGNKEYFSELNENIKGKVRFGDGSCVEIAGKGAILFQSKSNEQTLVKDVYYIPQLKSNILSLGQATEVGCDVRMRQDYLTLHDPKGRLLVKAIRSPNRLYKIALKTWKPICLHTSMEDDTWKRHARLGETIKAVPTRNPGMFHMRWGEVEDAGEGPTVVGPQNHDETQEDETDWNIDDVVPTEDEVWNNDKTVPADQDQEPLMRSNRPSDSKVIGLKLVFKIKMNDDGTINKYKAWLVDVEHVPGAKVDILTKALARIKLGEMRSLIRVQDMSKMELKLKGVNVG